MDVCMYCLYMCMHIMLLGFLCNFCICEHTHLGRKWSLVVGLYNIPANVKIQNTQEQAQYANLIELQASVSICLCWHYRLGIYWYLAPEESVHQKSLFYTQMSESYLLFRQDQIQSLLSQSCDLGVVKRLVCLNDPESYAGGGLGPWQVQPFRIGLR